MARAFDGRARAAFGGPGAHLCGVVYDFHEEVRRRRDQSLYVTHFTKEIVRAGRTLSPADVLFQILRERCINASEVGDRVGPGGADARAVCLTESPLLGLIVPTRPRSPAHGIGFAKRFVYAAGGMPALYVRRDLLGAAGPPVDPRLVPFVKPFDMEKENMTFEREWRVPCDLAFDLSDVAYLIVPREERRRFVEAFTGLQRVLDYEFLLEAL